MTKELNFYIIVTDAQNTDKIHGIIKRVCEHWSHYIDNMWMVATSMNRDELIELIWERGSHLIVASCDMVKGYLTPPGWKWLSDTDNAIRLSKMATPSLTDMYELGHFNELMSCSHCIRDIDNILDLYKEAARTPFELEIVRNRMIERLKDKIIKDSMRLA